ncbi:MAG: LysM peptidoglycan-binding domain-containing M23 family metallopeptidase [Rhodospirillaceae bacterium]|nr:LysM peptidoglycan-binding domain-containing M23 family metallopeptidase [Rhodospirillales bacterium]
MSVLLPHVVRRSAMVLLITVALAACDPNWQGGGAPVTRGPMAHAGCGGTVTTYSGDTVYSIARRCNVSVRELIEANRLQAPYLINPGMLLRVPGGSGEYVVQRGDTLLVVARRLKVDFQALARTNGKGAPYTIKVGEKLRVPGSYVGEVQTAQLRSNTTTGPLVIASPNALGGAKPPSKAPTTTISKLPPPEPVPQVTPPPTPEPETRHVAFQPQASLPPPPPPPLAGKGFIWPCKGEVINEFGPLAKGQHSDGVNIAAPRGTPVKAAENGVIAYVGNELKGFGNLLLVKHADGWMTAYAHNDQLMVKKGESVRKGQQIATVGASGNVTSPQLHFEIRKGTEAVNPADYIKGDAISWFGLLGIGDA